MIRYSDALSSPEIYSEKIQNEINRVGFCVISNVQIAIDNLIDLILNKINQKLITHDSPVQFLSLDEFLWTYHEKVDDHLHAHIWTKEARALNLSEEKINQMLSPVIQSLESITKRRVLDVEGWGQPEIYFRLVRPNCIRDIAGWHTDGAFYEVTNRLRREAYESWYKVWFPLAFEPYQNTLGVLPFSHQTKFSFRTIVTEKPRPELEDSLELTSMDKPVKRVGDFLVFSPLLMHGAINTESKNTRLSIEFAMG